MSSLCNCECVPWLEYFFQKIKDMWHEVDNIMTQNAATTVENSHVQTVTEKEREMFAVAMHNLPLFEDDIKDKKPFTSSTRKHANSFQNTKKSQEEYYKQLQKQHINIERDLIQLNKSKTLSNQNAEYDLKDSAVQHVEDMEWEIIDLEEDKT